MVDLLIDSGLETKTGRNNDASKTGSKKLLEGRVWIFK